MFGFELVNFCPLRLIILLPCFIRLVVLSHRTTLLNITLLILLWFKVGHTFLCDDNFEVFWVHKAHPYGLGVQLPIKFFDFPFKFQVSWFIWVPKVLFIFKGPTNNFHAKLDQNNLNHVAKLIVTLILNVQGFIVCSWLWYYLHAFNQWSRIYWDAPNLNKDTIQLTSTSIHTCMKEHLYWRNKLTMFPHLLRGSLACSIYQPWNIYQLINLEL